MQDIHHRRSISDREVRSTDAIHYRLILLVAFIALFIPMALARLFASETYYAPQAARSKSLLIEVRDAAHRCAGISMQG